uniref:MADS-box domain-containing protein n=1 Tax=Oryza nivara TaxID=4536 RepID=A0A0E0FX92_ORYNI
MVRTPTIIPLRPNYSPPGDGAAFRREPATYSRFPPAAARNECDLTFGQERKREGMKGKPPISRKIIYNHRDFVSMGERFVALCFIFTMSPCIDATLFVRVVLDFVRREETRRDEMPRTKLVLKLIENEKKRKATFKNRRDGLKQKVSQFATLCGVEALLICVAPAVAGGEVTTWPPDRAAVLDLIARLRATPPEKIRQLHNTQSLLRDDLDKQQRLLLKVQKCGADDVLTPWHCSLYDLSLDGLNALHDTLSETLDRAHRRIAALGGGHGHVHDDAASSSEFSVPAPAPHAVALPDNAFDFPFAPSNTGPVVGAHYFYPLHDTLPLPLPLPQQVPGQHPPCIAYQMPPPPCLAYQMPPPPPPSLAAAPFDQCMSATGFMDSNPYATHIMHGGSTAAGLLDDHGQIFSAGAGYDDDDILGHGFGFAAGTGYDLDPRMATADVWPMNTLNNIPNDGGIGFQLQNDLKWMLPGGSNGSNLQGGFQI